MTPITLRYLVGQVEQLPAKDTQARMELLASRLAPSDLCFWVDTSTVQGQSLYEVLPERDAGPRRCTASTAAPWSGRSATAA
jgi:hypothetical protein